MTSNEILETKIDNLVVRMEENFKRQDEKIDMVKQFFENRVDNTDKVMNKLVERCDHCPLEHRMKDTEDDIKGLNRFRYYVIAIVSFITFIVPYIWGILTREK